MGFFKKSMIEKIESYKNRGFREEIEELKKCREEYNLIYKERRSSFNSVKKDSLLNLKLKIEENEEKALDFLSHYDFLNKPKDPFMAELISDSKAAINNYKGIPDALPKGKKDFIDDAIGAFTDHLDKVSDNNMKEKLKKTISLLTEIWKKEDENKDHHDVYRKLESYYIPTVISLLDTYEEAFDKEGENANTIRTETERSVDILNQVLTNVYNDAYGDDALNVSTESNVLSMVAKRDGLIDGSDFS